MCNIHLTNMVGNFVFGAGEQFVSGEKNASPFTISRPGRKHQGDKFRAPHVAYFAIFMVQTNAQENSAAIQLCRRFRKRTIRLLSRVG
jgi:hypothetical protein